MTPLASRADIERAVVDLTQRGRHIARVEWQGQPAWLKLAVPQPPAWRYVLLGALARSLKLDAIRPVRPYGGTRGLGVEAGRIRALREAGLVVPEIFAEGAGWLVLADLGAITLEHLMRRATDPAERLRHWRTGAAYLVATHRAGQHLSQAFSRNFVWSEDTGLGAIDFEDDASSVMPLASAQVRDWLPYLFSTATYFHDGLPEFVRAVDEAFAAESPPVVTGVRRVLARTAWVRVARRLPARMQRGDVVKTWRYGEFAYRAGRAA